MNNAIEQAGWKVHWKVTETAGLLIYLASYRGRRVLWEGSLPYVTIDHERQTLSVDDEGGDEHGPFWAPLGVRNLVVHDVDMVREVPVPRLRRVGADLAGVDPHLGVGVLGHRVSSTSSGAISGSTSRW